MICGGVCPRCKRSALGDPKWIGFAYSKKYRDWIVQKQIFQTTIIHTNVGAKYLLAKYPHIRLIKPLPLLQKCRIPQGFLWFFFFSYTNIHMFHVNPLLPEWFRVTIISDVSYRLMVDRSTSSLRFLSRKLINTPGCVTECNIGLGSKSTWHHKGFSS